MLTKLGKKFTDLFQKYMPSAFVFALALTLLTGLVSLFWMNVKPMTIISGWYDGFFSLLEFGMQITLFIITGYSIALSPIIGTWMHKLAAKLNSPKQVYYFVVIVGALLSLVSFGWIVITAKYNIAIVTSAIRTALPP